MTEVLRSAAGRAADRRERSAALCLRAAVSRGLTVVVVLGVISGLCSSAAWASVSVLSNQTGLELTLEQPERNDGRPLRILPGAAIRIDCAEDLAAVILTALGQYQSKVELRPYGVYYVVMQDDRLTVKEIDLSLTEAMRASLVELAPAANDPPLEIEVKLLVDEDQPARQSLWEPLLRRRIATASGHLEACCRVRLKVVAVDSWNSDNALTDLSEVAREFRRQVDPAPARLAIGFTFQQRVTVAEVLERGTIDEPLTKHLLLPLVDAPPRSQETLKEMLLVHELGHFLGAVHAAEPANFMQTAWQANESRDRHSFDPLNMLIMNLVREQMQQAATDSLGELSQPHKQAIARCYATLSQALEDPWRDALRQRLVAPPPAPPRQLLPREIRAAEVPSLRQPNRGRVFLDDATKEIVLMGR